MPVVPVQIARSNDGVLFTMPFQYVMGMPKRTLAYVDNFIPSSVTRVDLDSNTVWQGNGAHLSTFAHRIDAEAVLCVPSVWWVPLGRVVVH